ncbi:MAG: hypothetical protein Q8K75_11290 [Chlamydiales bacterium]|nr:hypothetical protein [Chlamydiales bacterium]
MRSLAQFFQGLWQMPWYHQLWTLLLAVVNFVIPFFFIQHLEAQIVIGVFIVNVITLTSLTALLGHTRLVSLGHALWLPLVYFLILQLPEFPTSSVFGIWLRILILLDSIALVLDAVDVFRYVRGNRKIL